MDPVLKAVLLSWDWRADVIIVLALAGMLYTMGWWRLRQRTQRRLRGNGRSSGGQLATGWRMLAYWGGLLLLAVTLMSPVDVLSNQLFLMHMIQHLLLVMVVPPLLLMANPMPFILWGLPDPWRLSVGRVIGRLLHRASPFRRGLRSATAPGIVWLLWVISLVGWHDPAAYTAALRSDFVHDLEHLSFFLTSMLFWWHVIGAGPRIHRQFGVIGRVVYVLSAVPPNMLTGVVIAFAATPIYDYYTAVPRLWGISVMTDQQLGGVIMWVPGSMMYLIAALVLIAQMLQGENRKPALPESEWGTDEALIAPGVKK